MTYKLVFENLKHRPVRALLSALLIAVPVTLILTLVGLSRGMLEDSARRARGVGADILVRPQGTSLLSLSGAPMNEGLVNWMRHQPHVTLATGTMVHVISGVTTVTGVDLPVFNQMSGGFKYLEGAQFQGPNDIIIDEYYARQKNAHAGQTVNVLNRDWRVAGVVEAGKLTRIALPLRTLQELTGNSGKISQVYVKVDDPGNVSAAIASLKSQLEGYPIYSMAEYTSLISVDNIPGLRAFINVVMAIGVIIGFAVVCLSMYMAVLQRTREIGILKSLGASRWYIMKIILAEALLLGLGGTIAGIVLSFGARGLILALVPASLTQAVVPDWWPIAGLVSLAGALLGALYPGLSAARQDPIEALAYE
jgi:putative ABC transport system permease protein